MIYTLQKTRGVLERPMGIFDDTRQTRSLPPVGIEPTTFGL